ncbi:MAG: hypothetical protein NTY13_06235 [Chlamydiae bacterium]|nr:hypothetical protein [Chlamydiota bacterium]
MAEISDEALQDDIAFFFTPRVHAYLQKSIRSAQLIGRIFSPSNALNIIRDFETEISHLPSAEVPENDYQATLDLWKKTFTRNILVPKYLLNDPHIDIEYVLQLMQGNIYNACQEVKAETYVQYLKKTIVSSLRHLPILERPQKAYQILHSSIKVLERLEKIFPTEQVLLAFSSDQLESLVIESITPLIPLPAKTPSGSTETHPLKKKCNKKTFLNNDLHRDTLKSFLHSHLILQIQEALSKAPSLLAKLQIVSTLLETRKELVILWVAKWEDKPTIEEVFLIDETLQALPHIVTQIRGEVLAHYCIEEMYKARNNTPPQAYIKIRTTILERYLRFYLQEEGLKKYFLKALQEEESTELTRFLPLSSTQTAKKQKFPDKTSFWHKV